MPPKKCCGEKLVPAAEVFFFCSPPSGGGCAAIGEIETLMSRHTEVAACRRMAENGRIDQMSFCRLVRPLLRDMVRIRRLAPSPSARQLLAHLFGKPGAFDEKLSREAHSDGV